MGGVGARAIRQRATVPVEIHRPRNKTMKKTILTTILLLPILTASFAYSQPTAGPAGQLQRGVTQQLLASYADKLEARLKNRSVGYSFTVTGGSGNLMVSRAGGDARRAPD